jgi:hypothetical protein
MMRRAFVVLALAACSQASGGGDHGSIDAPVGGGGSDAAVDGHGPPPIDAPTGTYRTSLAVCWTDATCPRVLALAHGGAWDVLTIPYDSNAALEAAYMDGDDGVKIDVRVTKDNVPVIAHSSPITLYESLDCANQRIEDMTAAQVTACHRFPSSSQTFQRLDDVLGYLRGKMVVQLCVKQTADFARTIAEVHALGAEDFAFIEINAGDFETLGATLPGGSTVWFLVNVGSTLSAVDDVLALGNTRAFMVEIDPGVDIGTMVPDRLHPAGVRAFIYDSAASPSVAQLQAHYTAGFDAVSSQSGTNGVQARANVNAAHGLTPP